jgi:signal transduction histidine kinase/FixJ family two-component response regulator
MARLISEFDWASTPLGPMEAWPQSLKTVVGILLTSRYAMWMGWGSDLTFLYNDAYGQMTLGRKHPWALGRPASEVWEEIWPSIGPRIQSVLDTGIATWDDTLFLLLERSGYPEETYHTFSYSPLTDDGGAIVGNLCVVTEETDRVIADRRLASVRHLAAALAATRRERDSLATIERVLALNPKDLPFTLLYLLDEHGPQAGLVCHSGINISHPAAPGTIAIDEPDGVWPLGRALTEKDMVVVSDLRDRFDHLPSGAWGAAPDQAVVLPIAQQGQDRPAGFLVVGLDPYRPFDSTYRGFVDLLVGQIVSGLASARAYEQEKRRAESLAELDRAKTVFFSNVSHEFRTPLTLLLGPIEDALGGRDLQPTMREALELAHRNALRLLKLVNSLLDFSRIEAGRVEAAYEPTDLAAYTAELASSFRSATERAGLELVVDAPTLPEPVYIDHDMWEKTILNLLSNALKHTFDGRIVVRLRERDGAATVEVEDTGVGIPPVDLPRIFERFHRVPNARSRTHEGSGIGLALVHELVRLHGGRVEVASTEGEGTSFTVSVPFGTHHLPSERIRRSSAHPRRPHIASGAASYVEEALRWSPGAEVSDDDRASRNAGSDGADPLQDGAGARIVLADDNTDMRDYVARLLRSRGWTVDAVADGRAALESARAEPADLVLTDVMMPGLDGFALLRELRGDPRTSTVPVILLSARAGEEARVEGAYAGADDYVVKPFAAQELVARVSAHLALARERAKAAAAESAALSRTERLREASAALSAARTPDAVIAAALAAAARATGVTTGSITRLVDDGATFEIVAAVGYPEAHFRQWQRFANETGYPAAVAVATSAPVIVRSLAECAEMYPHILPALRALGAESVVDLPLLSGRGGGNTPLGVLSLCYQDAQAFPPEQLAFLRTLAEMTGQALDRALADQDEREARSEAEEQRAEADRQRLAAEKANRAKSDFLAVMSHELRTPLNAIAGHVQLLEMEMYGPLTDTQRDALARVARSQRHLLGLVNEVLSLSRIEAGRVEYAVADIVLQDVAAGLAPMIEPQIAAKGLSYEFRAPAAPVIVRVDHEKLDQVLLNLLSNAVKFTPPGGRITVEVVAPRANGQPALVRVIDTGIGIATEQQQIIFEPFVQVQAGPTRAVQGTGLGLAIARDLARGMGGDLSVESAAGQGSTFTVTLPTG